MALGIAASVDLPEVDTDVLLAALPHLFALARRLSFDGGGALDDPLYGRREGLRLISGAHPLPGSRYEIVPRVELDAGVEPALAWDVVADDRAQLHLRHVGEDGRVDVVVREPADPSRLSLEAALGRGIAAMSLSAAVALDHLHRTTATGTQLEATLLHRWLVAEVSGGLHPRGARAWAVHVDVRIQGRGLARPIVAAVTPVLRRRAARSLRRALDAGVRTTTSILRTLAPAGEGDPERVAHRAMSALLERVAVAVPKSRT